jgi:UMF1 family MFS transporter
MCAPTRLDGPAVETIRCGDRFTGEGLSLTAEFVTTDAHDAPSRRPAGAALPRAGMLERLGLHRPELRAWAMYDWANSAFLTVITTAVFPIFYSSVASAGVRPEVATFRYGVATTIGLALIALAAPGLGALADVVPIKKRLLGLFMAVGVVATALMFFIERGDWLFAATLFVVANIGVNGSFVFYDSFLPHVARPDEVDRVSTAGYALGYVGGGLLLALNLAWIQRPAWFGLPSGPGLSPNEATLPARLAFVSVAVWWVAFAVPFFRRVPEPAVHAGAAAGGAGGAFRQLAATFRELRGFRNALLMLVAFLVYNDGIGTIIRMATIYGTEIGIGRGALITAVVLVQFVGIPFAFAFGALADRITAKRAIFIGLAAYTVISMIGYFMRTAAHFFALSVLVGMVQGGTQALSRSLFSSMIPQHKAGQFFGFFAVFEKFAGILGPLVFSLAIAVGGSSRGAILSVIAFFVVGAALLARVDVAEGQRAARAAERAAQG